MKDYTQIKNQKELIEKHIAFLKQQYLNAIMSDDEWHNAMQEATAALKKVNKQLYV
jgi:hypothetical protein